VIDQQDKVTPAVPFRPTAISLFAGAGGCSLGFGQAGYDVRFATDLDADAVESNPDFKPLAFERSGNCGEFATIKSLADGRTISGSNSLEFDGIRNQPKP
jgi:hypothetical protein